MRAYRDRFEHHLLLKMAGSGIGEAREYLETLLPGSEMDPFECTPEEAEKACHVFHLDYLIRADVAGVRERLKSWLDTRGARYPAEHNFGHLYRAPPELVEFYRTLDPTNSLNPGIGQTSAKRDWS